MSDLVRFSSGDNDVAKRTQVDPQNPTAKFVPLEPGQVLFGLEVIEDGSLLGTIYYDYKDKNGIITRVNMGNGGVGGSNGGLIKTLATTDGKHDSEETTAAANVVIPLPKKIFANLLSAKTQFNFPKVHDPSNTNYVNEDAAPGQSYLYGNGLHMVNPFSTLQDSWIRTIGTKGSAEATLELAMRDNASSEYIYDQIVARHYKADGTVVTDKNGRKREVVILGKNGESQFPGPVTSNGGFVGDVTGNAASATKAKNDWYDQVIDSTYLSKVIKTAHDGSKFEITSYDGRYTPVGADEAKKSVITIPGATTSAAGLVTTGAQTFTGNKTINSSGSLTIQKEGGFVYSGIVEDKASNANVPIWFATSGTNGTPKYSTEFTYNPSTGTVTAKKFAGPATSATYDAEGGEIHEKYLKRAGGTMTGALNFADNTYNAFGNDVEIGSQNAAGKLSIHGKNGATGIVFVPYSGSTSQTISIDGAGVMTITGTLKATLDGNASTATKLQTARTFHITDSSATYNGANVSFDGTGDVTLHMPSTFAGSLKGNADTATKLETARTLWGQSFNGSANVTGAMSNVGNITSLKTNTHDIGSSSNVWKNIYATTFHGALDGKATSAGSADMANQVTHVLTIEGQSYDGSTDVAVGNTIFYIVGNSTDTTAGTWTGTDSKIKNYYNGLTIIYVPAVAGASTTTLNLNGLGAKPCYYSNTSKLTTHFSKGTPIMLTYIDGYWKRADYDSNTNTQIRVYRQVTSTSSYNGEYPLLASRTKASGIGTAGRNSSYTSVYGVMSDDTTKIPTVNIHTGAITATSFKGIATNALNDANGNKIDETYVKLAGDTMTGALTTPTLTLSSTSGVGHLNFSRASVNYITAPASGYFAFVPNGLSVGIVNSALVVAATSVYPGATNKISLGTSSYKWANVYATKFTGALVGNADTATKLQTARSFHIADSSAVYNGASAVFNGTEDITLHMPDTFTGHLVGNADNDGNGVNIAQNYMRSELIEGNLDAMQAALAGKTGRTGSINLTKKESGTGSQVPAGWYNYLFTPHRTGIGGDNDLYGTTLIFPMTFSGNSYIVRRASKKDVATEVRMIIDSGNIGKQSVDNADKVDGYHASSLWRSDGAVWNPGANVSMTGAANGQEWSFDFYKGGMTGLYWQVWEETKATLLRVDADTGKVSAPYGFVGALTGNASSATKLLTNGKHTEVASNLDTSVWVNKNGMLHTSGMYMTETYSDANTPAAYGNIINLAGGGAGQLLLEWTSTTSTGHIYYRDQRDVAGSGDWHSWQKVAFVTDNVASADKWATSRNFQVDLALDNPSTVKVDGTKDVILPVTGVLATKHGGTGQSTHTKNRLVWSEEATKLSAANNHYVDATHIGINYTSTPSYNLHVAGTSYLDGNATISAAHALLFTATTGGTTVNTPTALTYGRLQSYGTLAINADTDGSKTEYVILTAGRGMSNSTSDGLTVGYEGVGIKGYNKNYTLYVGGTTYHTQHIFVSSDAEIRQHQRDTSNYTILASWLKNETGWTYDNSGTKTAYTYQPHIGQHNVGGTNGLGSVVILPYATNTDPWGKTVGLYITKNLLQLDNRRIPTTGNTSGTVGSTTQPVYVNAGIITPTAYALKSTVEAGTANRMAYFSGANTIDDASTIYANNTQLGINTTSMSTPKLIWDSAATQVAETVQLQVSGKSYFTNTVIIESNHRAIEFRPNHASYNSYIYYGTSGNEALNFVNQNVVTSFMFWTGNSVNGSNQWYLNEDGSARADHPAVQIKKNSLYINQLLPHNTDPSYTLYTNGTSYFNGLVTVLTGATHRGIKLGNTYINAIDGNLILQNNGTIRFGADNWDYNCWAGLKYEHGKKKIAIGLADGTEFTANTPQSDGRITTAGISAFNVGPDIGGTDTHTGGKKGVMIGYDANNGKIELSGVSPYIDFHHDNSQTNYTGRIISKTELVGSESRYGLLILPRLGVNDINYAFNLSVKGNQGITAAANRAMTLDTANSNKIGTTPGDLHIQPVSAGSGSAITNGNVSSITFGCNNVAYAGIYSPASGSYGNHLIFATTNAYANGAYGRMIITAGGNVGIGTMDPGSYKLYVSGAGYFTGAVTATAFTATTENSFNSSTVMRIKSSSTMYLNRGASTSLIFQLNGTEHARFNTAGHLVPGTTSAFDIGTSTNVWRNIYATTFHGALSGNATSADVARYVSSPDTRSTAINPSSLSAAKGVQFDFKQSSAIGLSAANYSGVMTYRPYSSSSDWSGGPAHQVAYNEVGIYHRRSTGDSSWGSWLRMWRQGDSVTSAVWNDYAECRQAETEEAGYVLYETGRDDLKKTTERLQHFAGVSSDTWGFSQGETEKAKTPIAVAGRVLVYPYQGRDNYQPGDCVCAAPGGTVDIMTREEVIQYPDRIVGTVSCVPDYEEWGGGESADRDPIKVNGRIWIKVR